MSLGTWNSISVKSVPYCPSLPPHHNHFIGFFFWDHPGEPVPEQNYWTLWCKGRLTEAETPTIRLGATSSGLTSALLHHPPIFFYRPDALPAAQPTASKHCASVQLQYLVLCVQSRGPSGYLHPRGFWCYPSLLLAHPYVSTIVPHVAGHAFHRLQWTIPATLSCVFLYSSCVRRSLPCRCTFCVSHHLPVCLFSLWWRSFLMPVLCCH